MNIGEKLYELRTEKNMSQETLAELVGVSRQSVSKWETGQSVPDLDKLFRLCDVYGVTLDELTGRLEAKHDDDVVSEVKDIVNPILNAIIPKIIGAVLLLLSAILFIVLCFKLVYLEAMIISLPFFVGGVICVVCKKRILLSYSVFLYFYFTSFFLWGYGIVTDYFALTVGVIGAVASFFCFIWSSKSLPLFQTKRPVPRTVCIVLWCLYGLLLFFTVAFSRKIFFLIYDAWVVSDMSFNSWTFVMLGAAAFFSAVKCIVTVVAVTVSFIVKQQKSK